mmetsp:Transcript_4639/g.11240  ORF Transcript_4639/g.11240 Transcript_4639/m.11240 type:complete len:288 (-) Transcript_4639:1872-2735(-)
MRAYVWYRSRVKKSFCSLSASSAHPQPAAASRRYLAARSTSRRRGCSCCAPLLASMELPSRYFSRMLAAVSISCLPATSAAYSLAWNRSSTASATLFCRRRCTADRTRANSSRRSCPRPRDRHVAKSSAAARSASSLRMAWMLYRVTASPWSIVTMQFARCVTIACLILPTSCVGRFRAASCAASWIFMIAFSMWLLHLSSGLLSGIQFAEAAALEKIASMSLQRPAAAIVTADFFSASRVDAPSFTVRKLLDLVPRLPPRWEPLCSLLLLLLPPEVAHVLRPCSAA